MKAGFDSSFYKGVNPETQRDFFDLVSLKLKDGREIKIFKGFLQTALKAIKKQQKEIIQATNDGKEFARAIGGSL